VAYIEEHRKTHGFRRMRQSSPSSRSRLKRSPQPCEKWAIKLR
jgi:hypothetical protein